MFYYLKKLQKPNHTVDLILIMVTLNTESNWLPTKEICKSLGWASYTPDERQQKGKSQGSKDVDLESDSR